MTQNPRFIAVAVLNRVDEERSYAGPLLDHCLSGEAFTEKSDKALATNIVYGTLRRRGELDFLIGSFFRGDIDRMDTGIRNILRTALFQILHTDRIPPYAAVNEAVEMTKKAYPGRSGLVNGILRNIVRSLGRLPCPALGDDPMFPLSVQLSHPPWLLRKWIFELGEEEAKALCEANNEIPPLTIRINRIKNDRSAIIENLRTEGWEAKPCRYATAGVHLYGSAVPVSETSYFREGLLQVQDEASQMIAPFLDPLPGHRVLDLCAGAGIKTTHLAELMENRGMIVAVDNKKRKIDELEVLSRRHGVSIIETVTADATEFLGEKYRGVFDRILVDAPCSGLGTLRRNPEIKWQRQSGEIQGAAELQRRLLAAAVQYMKKGGVMVYSTCAISREENEGNAGAFLDARPDFRRASPPGHFPVEMLDGENSFRSYPHRHGTDGFYAVRLTTREKG
ncbi:MAG: 16S rRNA (cytosine(967)-C(5))-methyltransferase RsmB [Deltaproteobacteria bacterium]|nr:16S rRNA (cytosine(967)-C(5))-methyltransferase RsmB [Deltaproteobacteria bacterium]